MFYPVHHFLELSPIKIVFPGESLNVFHHALDLFRGQRDLPDGENFCFPDFLYGNLRVEIELSQRLHLIAEKLHSNGVGECGLKHIHDIAANAELTASFYHVNASVAIIHQAGFQKFPLQGISFFQRENLLPENGFRNHALHGGLYRNHQERAVFVHELVENKQALA